METDLKETLLSPINLKKEKSINRLRKEALDGKSIDSIFKYVAKQGKDLA